MEKRLKSPVRAHDETVALKQQIANLQKSEAFFRAITQNTSDIVIIVNKKAVITYVNPAIEHWLGYKPDELIGQSGFDYIAPADIARALYDFGQAILTKEINIRNSFGVKHKNGSTRILEGIGCNLFKNPAVKGFVMNVRDVTDRVQAEKSLNAAHKHLESLVGERTSELCQVNEQMARELAEHRRTRAAFEESERQYREFLENAPIGVGMVDIAGNVQYINKRIEDLMGWKREKVVGQNGFNIDIFDEGTRKRLMERLTARLQGDHPRLLEIPVTTKDGNQLWVEVIGTILTREGKPVGAQMVFANVTERKLAEEALRRSEDRFRKLIQSSSDVISILDANGHFIYSSPSVEPMFGLAPESLTEKSPLDLIHPDDLENVRQKFLRLTQEARQMSPLEFRGMKGDGTWGYFEAMGSNLLDDPGINGIVLTIRDITERKLADEERKALTERLHRAEKMESLGTLAGGVAHDLNNVLGVLVGYSELLIMKMEDDNPLKKHLHSILKSSEKATAIIQDMLTLARRGVPVSDVVNFNRILFEYFQTPEHARLKAYHPQVTIIKELGHDLLNVKGSPVHLGKAAMNLISNAVEAITGEGSVTISTCNVYLDKPVSGHNEISEGDYVALAVRDNGQGIAQADVEKIFEPFYTKKVMGRSGTGLGLAVVWGTVKDHEGYIEVQSDVGKGSVFTLYFPATREALKRPSRAVPIDTYISRGESILVVDDIQEQREVATSLLARLGYQAHALSSGEEAVEYLKNNNADVLVLDMLMDPGIDGLETYRRILEIRPKQKAVIVSGYSETDRVKQALKLGVSAYVRKPYLLENIGVAIRKTLLTT
ncbi:MAG: PAS domain S-box protein [Smithellaceae bacterium]